MRFLVSNIGRESLILGYPWLAAFEPRFQWKEGTLDLQYLPIKCQSLGPMKEPDYQKEQQAIAAQLKEECTNRGISTNLAIQAKSEPTHVELSPVYRRYASVFRKKKRSGFCLPAPGIMQLTLKTERPTPSTAKCTL